MFVRIKERKKGDIDLGLIYGGIGIFGFLGARFFSRLTVLIPPCPFHHLTGIPCPTCGSTRSGILLSQFKVLEAFWTNPLFVLVCCGVGMWALSSLVLLAAGKKVQIVQWGGSKAFLRIFAIGMIVANWVYLIITRA
jgi:hypothetical protein